MNLFRLTILCSAFAFAGTAQAEIYKRVDKDGHVTYSSAPVKGAKKLQLEPLSTMAAQPIPSKARNNSGASSDLRVNSETQNRRDDTRRKILEDELATEQKALEDARLKLKEGEEKPEVFQQTVVVGKTKDGAPITQTVTRRNVAAYEEKIRALQEEASAHEKNVEALQTELSNLK